MKSRRKIQYIIINPKFQFSFISYVLAILLFCIFFFYLADLYFFKEMSALGQEIKLPKNHIYFEILDNQKSVRDKIFIVTGTLISIFVFIFGLIMSHKVAGPLYKLNKYLNESIELEKLEELRFRKGDYFQEIPVSFNKFITRKIKK